MLGTQIRHGINRDFPTDYRGQWGSRSTTGFVLEEVRLDGDAVPTQLSRLENGVRIRIGDPDQLVPHGVHTYTIRYLAWWQVSFRSDRDGLDWNVTGNGWTWPIDRAELRLRGPEGLVLAQCPVVHRAVGKSRRGRTDCRRGARLSRRGHDQAALPS